MSAYPPSLPVVPCAAPTSTRAEGRAGSDSRTASVGVGALACTCCPALRYPIAGGGDLGGVGVTRLPPALRDTIRDPIPAMPQSAYAYEPD